MRLGLLLQQNNAVGRQHQRVRYLTIGEFGSCFLGAKRRIQLPIPLPGAACLQLTRNSESLILA